jgi:hypothetical protein
MDTAPATELVPAAAPANPALVREEFNGREATSAIEMHATSLAAKAKATIESRYVLAMRRQRNLETVRIKLLAECRDPFFADEAIYAVPRGREQNAKGEWVDVIVEDLSIRFAEAAARYMGNLLIEAPVVLETADQRMVQIVVTDLETNLTYDLDVVVPKTRERKSLRQNEVELSRRFGSRGQLIYIVATPESELTNQVAAAVSKATRTLILRMVPAGIKAECKAVCNAVLEDKHAKDPAAERKKLCDGFARMGVLPHELTEYIGRPLELITPAEFRHLVALGVALRDGNLTWAEAMEGRAKTGKPVAVPEPTKPAEPPPVGTVPVATAEIAAPAAATTPPVADPSPELAARQAEVAARAAAAAPAVAPVEPAATPAPAETAPAATSAPAAAAAPAKATGGPKGGSAATKAALKADKDKAAKDATPAPAPIPGPGSHEWEAAQARARAKDAERGAPPPAAAPAPAPTPEPPPAAPPPPASLDEIAGEEPDWMRT